MKRYSGLLSYAILFSLFLGPKVWASCNYLTGLPDQNEFSSYSSVSDKVTTNSCSLIDQDPLYQDEDLKKHWCENGCQDKITDAQKKVYMPEMASPLAKRWHGNWHTVTRIYDPDKYRTFREAIDLIQAGKESSIPDKAPETPKTGGSNKGQNGGGMNFDQSSGSGKNNVPGNKPGSTPSGAPNGIPGPGDMPSGNIGDMNKPLPDPLPIQEDEWKTLTDNQILNGVKLSLEQVQFYMLYQDIPTSCKNEVPVAKQQPIKVATEAEAEYNPTKAGDMTLTAPKLEYKFDPDWKDCIKRNWAKDLRAFIHKNQNTGGENFLFMHHAMRNETQMMLNKAGLPCISAWDNIPGEDGKTGKKEGNWEEIWDVAPDKMIKIPVKDADGNIVLKDASERSSRPENGKLFSPNDEAEMKRLNLTKDEYLKKKSEEIATDFAKKKKDLNLDELKALLQKNSLDVVGKVFENEDFLKSVSMNELGKIMEGTIHSGLHGAFNNPAGCKYMDGGKEVNMNNPPTSTCELPDSNVAHIHATFWKLHGWCDNVMKKWLSAGDREYKTIGTDESCQEKACYRMNGTYQGGMH